jgi:hypothetical protein
VEEDRECREVRECPVEEDRECREAQSHHLQLVALWHHLRLVALWHLQLLEDRLVVELLVRLRAGEPLLLPVVQIMAEEVGLEPEEQEF